MLGTVLSAVEDSKAKANEEQIPPQETLCKSTLENNPSCIVLPRHTEWSRGLGLPAG